LNFKVKRRRSNYNSIYFKVINFDPKKIIFKEGNEKLQLTVHKELKLRTLKKILTIQKNVDNIWFRFKSNESMFGDNNRIADLRSSCELIEIESFEASVKFLMFQYLNGCFKMEFDNVLEFGIIETEIRNKIGIGDDMEFQDHGDRKIQKYELVQGLNIIKLVKYNRFISKKICEFINLKLKLSIGSLKFDIDFRCFDGWSKIGVMSHIGKMIGLKLGYIEFQKENSLSVYRSINYYEEIERIKADYRMDTRMILKDRCVPIDNLNRLGLKQILVRCLDSYNLLTFNENLNMMQLAS
jgi:hypothetical protein